MAPPDRGDARIPPIAEPRVTTSVRIPDPRTAPLATPASRTTRTAPPDEFQIMRRIDKLLNQLPTDAQDRVAEWLRSRVGERRRVPNPPGDF